MSRYCTSTMPIQPFGHATCPALSDYAASTVLLGIANDSSMCKQLVMCACIGSMALARQPGLSQG